MRVGEKPHFVSVSEVTSRVSLLSLVLTLASSQGPEVSSQRGVEVLEHLGHLQFSARGSLLKEAAPRKAISRRS